MAHLKDKQTRRQNKRTNKQQTDQTTTVSLGAHARQGIIMYCTYVPDILRVVLWINLANSLEETEGVIKNLKSGRAGGLDYLQAEHLKFGGNSLVLRV